MTEGHDKQNHLDRQNKIMDDIMPYNWLSGWMALNMLLSIFWSTYDVYDVAKFKPLGHLVADIDMQKLKIRSCKDRITLGTWNVRSMNTGKLSTVKYKISQLQIDVLGIS